MSPGIDLEVYGIPAAQGSKSAIVVGGKVRVVEGKTTGQRVKHRSWRDDVRAAAIDTIGCDPTDPAGGAARAVIPAGTAVEVEGTLWLPRPVSAPKRVTIPVVSPDFDKMLRSTFDALTGIIYADDRQISRIVVERRFATHRPPPDTGRPGATLTIRSYL